MNLSNPQRPNITAQHKNSIQNIGQFQISPESWCIVLCTAVNNTVMDIPNDIILVELGLPSVPNKSSIASICRHRE